MAIKKLLATLTVFAATMAALYAFAADAQNSVTGGPTSRGDLLKIRQYRTEGALAYFVDSTGNDSNACTSTGTDACLTIQGALNKVPKLIQDLVTVTVASGNYAGAYIDGYTFAPRSGSSSTAGLILQGTLANITPATGTATGTLTAVTAGSSTTTAWGTLTDSGQTWTASNLQGHLVIITGGTGSGSVYSISDNTATAITIAGNLTINGQTAPTAGSTYAIQDPATVCTSGVTGPSAPGGNNVTNKCFLFSNVTDMNGTFSSGGSTLIRYFNHSLGSNGYLVDKMAAATLAIRGIRISTASGYILAISATMGGGTTYIGSSALVASNCGFLRVLSNGQSSTFMGGNVATGNSGFLGCNSQCGTMNIRALYVNGLTGASPMVSLTGAGPTNLQVQGSSFTGSGPGGFFLEQNSASSIQDGTMAYIVSSSSFTNLTGVFNIRGRASVAVSGITGTGNTTAFKFGNSAMLTFDSTTTLTGTTEVSIDGTTTTLAAIRALTPKVITTAFGTTVEEFP